MKNIQPIQTVTNEQLYAKLCEVEALLNKPTIHQISRPVEFTIQNRQQTKQQRFIHFRRSRAILPK